MGPFDYISTDVLRAHKVIMKLMIIFSFQIAHLCVKVKIDCTMHRFILILLARWLIITKLPLI